MPKRLPSKSDGNKDSIVVYIREFIDKLNVAMTVKLGVTIGLLGSLILTTAVYERVEDGSPVATRHEDTISVADVWRFKRWQLTSAMHGRRCGDFDAFKWESQSLTPSESNDGTMQLRGFSEGAMFIDFHENGHHMVYCGDHFRPVYRCDVKFFPGNFLCLRLFETTRLIEEDSVALRELWFLLQDVDRPDSLGRFLYASASAQGQAIRSH